MTRSTEAIDAITSFNSETLLARQNPSSQKIGKFSCVSFRKIGQDDTSAYRIKNLLLRLERMA